jgi:hypothetical protein
VRTTHDDNFGQVGHVASLGCPDRNDQVKL